MAVGGCLHICGECFQPKAGGTAGATEARETTALQKQKGRFGATLNFLYQLLLVWSALR